MMTWQQWLNQAIFRLHLVTSPSARLDAEILLAHVTNVERSNILAFGETLLTHKQQNVLEKLLVRREQGEPIAYLIGEREFWSLPIYVSQDTLIPRCDTECLVKCVLDLLSPLSSARLLDLGTGSGAIALALASERPLWQITGIDYSRRAIALARSNAIRLNIKNIKFFKSDWFKKLLPMKHYYNLIASNPPYIGKYDPHLMYGDIRFEPRSALVAGEDGLKDLKIICSEAGAYLTLGGWLVLEHGCRQGSAVRKLLNSYGFINIVTVFDHGNHERVSYGQWLPKKMNYKVL